MKDFGKELINTFESAKLHKSKAQQINYDKVGSIY